MLSLLAQPKSYSLRNRRLSSSYSDVLGAIIATLLRLLHKITVSYSRTRKIVVYVGAV